MQAIAAFMTLANTIKRGDIVGVVGQPGQGGAGGRDVVGRQLRSAAVGGLHLLDQVAQTVRENSHVFKVQEITPADTRATHCCKSRARSRAQPQKINISLHIDFSHG